jgi:hypothetical protein
VNHENFHQLIEFSLTLYFCLHTHAETQLRREQEMQQQKLWRDFQEQKKELELQHKMQIESKLQVSNKFTFSSRFHKKILFFFTLPGYPKIDFSFFYFIFLKMSFLSELIQFYSV